MVAHKSSNEDWGPSVAGEHTKEILPALKVFFVCRHMDNGQRVQLRHCLQMNLQNDTAVLTDSEYSANMFV